MEINNKKINQKKTILKQTLKPMLIEAEYKDLDKNKTHNCFGKIFGFVQGVGYREWLKKTAENLKFGGWVKNCKDKTVEFEVNGKKRKNAFLLKIAIKDHYFQKFQKLI